MMRRMDTIAVIRHRLQGSGNRLVHMGCAGPNAETQFVENPLVADFERLVEEQAARAGGG